MVVTALMLRQAALWDSFTGASYETQVQAVIPLSSSMSAEEVRAARRCRHVEPAAAAAAAAGGAATAAKSSPGSASTAGDDGRKRDDKNGAGVADVHRAVQALITPDSAGRVAVAGYGERVPLGEYKFRNIVEQLKQRGAGSRYRLSLAEAEEIAMRDCHLRDRASVHAMLQRFSDLGLLIWRHKSQLQGLVMLDAQWLIDHATALLCTRAIDEKVRRCASTRRHWRALKEEGRFDPVLLPELWPAAKVLEIKGGAGRSRSIFYTKQNTLQRRKIKSNQAILNEANLD